MRNGSAGSTAILATQNQQLAESKYHSRVRIPPSPPENKGLSHLGLSQIGSGFYAPVQTCGFAQKIGNLEFRATSPPTGVLRDGGGF
jgi:hypothetical protein